MSLKDVYELSLLLTGDDSERNDLERKKLALSAAVKQQEGRFIYEVEESQKHAEEVGQLAARVSSTQDNLNEKHGLIMNIHNYLQDMKPLQCFSSEVNSLENNVSACVVDLSGLMRKISSVEDALNNVCSESFQRLKVRKIEVSERLDELRKEENNLVIQVANHRETICTIQGQTQFFHSYHCEGYYEVSKLIVDIKALRNTAILLEKELHLLRCRLKSEEERKQFLLQQHEAEITESEKKLLDIILDIARLNNLCSSQVCEIDEQMATKQLLTFKQEELQLQIRDTEGSIRTGNLELRNMYTQLNDTNDTLKQFQNDLALLHSQERAYRAHSFDEKNEHLGFEAEEVRSIVIELQYSINTYDYMKENGDDIKNLKKQLQDYQQMKNEIHSKLQNIMLQQDVLKTLLEQETSRTHSILELTNAAIYHRMELQHHRQLLHRQLEENEKILLAFPASVVLEGAVKEWKRLRDQSSSIINEKNEFANSLSELHKMLQTIFQHRQKEAEIAYNLHYHHEKKMRVAKAKHAREQMIKQIENTKQLEVLEQDRCFQESIKLREKELIKRKEELGSQIQFIQEKLKSKERTIVS